jgi:hypothetical protein
VSNYSVDIISYPKQKQATSLWNGKNYKTS